MNQALNQVILLQKKQNNSSLIYEFQILFHDRRKSKQNDIAICICMAMQTWLFCFDSKNSKCERLLGIDDDMWHVPQQCNVVSVVYVHVHQNKQIHVIKI